MGQHGPVCVSTGKAEPPQMKFDFSIVCAFRLIQRQIWWRPGFCLAIVWRAATSHARAHYQPMKWPEYSAISWAGINTKPFRPTDRSIASLRDGFWLTFDQQCTNSGYKVRCGKRLVQNVLANQPLTVGMAGHK